jgi:hypothetical protein
MDELDKKYLQYFTGISADLIDEESVFSTLTDKLVQQFNTFGLTVEQKAMALTQIYQQQIGAINETASRAALALIQEERNTELTDAQLLTEDRKRQGYDDNVLIEIMKAQGSLASFAVNANSDTAQDTIDDLKEIMKTVEDRACDIVCDMPSFNLEFTITNDATLTENVFGGSDLIYDIIEQPETGSLSVNADGTFTYIPETDYVGLVHFKIKTTDDTMSVITAVSVSVTQP